MPLPDGSVSSTIKSIFCCSILRRNRSVLPISSEVGSSHENVEEPSTSLAATNISQSDLETLIGDDITPVPTNYRPAPIEQTTDTSLVPRTPEHRSLSPITIIRPPLLDSPKTPSPLIQPPAMFSPTALFRLSLCHEDIYTLRHLLSQSPSMATYRSILPQIYEILRREEVRYLFNNGDDRDYVVIGERVRFCEEILEVAYWDADSGGERRLAGWVERGLGGVVESNPIHHPSLTLLGRLWLLRSQEYLSKISEDGSNSSSSGGSFPFTNNDWTSADEDRDTVEQDRKRQEGVYVDARTCLFPAVEFLGRAVEAMEDGHGGVLGDVYVFQAEANMSLGNVTVSSEAQPYFRTAVEALKKASMIDGFRLPIHLERYLRSFEFVLYDD
ncbi:hypothetical protein TWF506_008177 [Arthrobotrys conoides]|uniref:Uncharacterized protein n=1 Tax=Arthrobotrys conoides TaxID=74498 RepID=A0AAN8RMH5_9PEZI